MSEEPLYILSANGSQCSTHRLDQSPLGAGADLPEDVLDLREGFLYGVSMRRHILSRANVVALERGNSISQSPFALRFYSQLRLSHSKTARCSMGSVRG